MQGKILSQHQIEVWSESVAQPVAVRYAWADNPVCNVQNKERVALRPLERMIGQVSPSTITRP